ncbi:MAG: hypothetical protein WA790_01425 [Sulfitobacter sp.]
MNAVIKHATLTPLTDESGKKDPNAKALTVQFNPETLEVTARSKLQEETGEKQDQTPVQVVAGTERSLALQLIFDETLTGEDVRNKTSLLIAMMQAGDAVLKEYDKGKKDKKVKVPKLVIFEWGNFAFKGVISECNETLDYFSPDGVPLRSSISCTLQERESVFTAVEGANAAGGVDGGMPVPPDTPLPSGPDVQSSLKQNGGESLRDSSTDEVFTEPTPDTEEGGSVRGALGGFSESASWSSKNGAVNAAASVSGGMDAVNGLGGGLGGGAGAGIKFGLPATAIASGKIGLGAGFDLGISAGVGFDAGIGGSLRGGIDLGAGLDLSGGDSLGLDAFAGLNPPKIDLGGKLASGMSALEDLGASFSGGASAGSQGAALFSAKADVGAKVDLGALLFGENEP